MPFAVTWIVLEIIIQSEVSQTRQTYDVTYMWNLKNDTKQNRLTDIEDKLMVTKGERGGINWEFGTNRYTQLYIK